MVIRPARVEDAPALGRVVVDTFLAAHRGQMPEAAWIKRRDEWTYAVSARSWERSLREMADAANPQECLYVAEDDAGEIVGMAWAGLPRTPASPETGEIHMLYVRQDCQGRGVGRRLVQAVAADLARRGRYALLIGCLAANTPARGFYEAIGGRMVAEREFDEAGFMLPEVVYGWPDTRTSLAGSDTGP